MSRSSERNREFEKFGIRASNTGRRASHGSLLRKRSRPRPPTRFPLLLLEGQMADDALRDAEGLEEVLEEAVIPVAR